MALSAVTVSVGTGTTEATPKHSANPAPNRMWLVVSTNTDHIRKAASEGKLCLKCHWSGLRAGH